MYTYLLTKTCAKQGSRQERGEEGSEGEGRGGQGQEGEEAGQDHHAAQVLPGGMRQVAGEFEQALEKKSEACLKQIVQANSPGQNM